jgi:hypothetical protein
VLLHLLAWTAFHSKAINERLMIMYATNRLPDCSCTWRR